MGEDKKMPLEEVSALGKAWPVSLWDGKSQPLTGKLLAWDTETHLIDKERPWTIPPAVILQAFDGKRVELVWWEDLRKYLDAFFALGWKGTMAFHNAPFDVNVLGRRRFVDLVDENQIVDTGLRFLLNGLAKDGVRASEEYPSLEFVARRTLGVKLDKDKDVRTTFRRERWPTAEQWKYAALDPIVTWLCAKKLGPQPTEEIQVKGHMMLDRISRIGLRANPEQFEKMRAKFEIVKVENAEKLLSWGIDVNKGKRLNGPEMLERIEERVPECAGKFAITRAGSESRDAKLDNLLVAVEKLIDSGAEGLGEVFSGEIKLKAKEKVEKLTKLEEAFEVEFPRTKAGKPTLKKLQAIHLLWAGVEAPAGEEREAMAQAWVDNDGWEYGDDKGPAVRTQELMAEIEASTPGLTLPKTPTGKYSTNADDVGMLDKGKHEFIDVLSDYKHAEKMISTYLNTDFIKEDGRIHTTFTPCLTTGRTSSRRPNTQNPPKEPGMREIYEAGPGNVLVAVDYSTLELCTLAEECYRSYGFSRMGDVINAGVDIHSWFALYMDNELEPWEVELDPENTENIAKLRAKIKRFKSEGSSKFISRRDLAKVCNFGS